VTNYTVIGRFHVNLISVSPIFKVGDLVLNPALGKSSCLAIHLTLKGYFMNTIRRLLLASFASLVMVGGVAAQERANKDEAIAMAKAAFEHVKKVGAEKAYADFTNDKASWTKKDLYVMVFDNNGVALAHGGNSKLVGKNLAALKDANGALIIAGLLSAAGKGGGWFDYDWPHPESKKVEGKSTYAIRQPDGTGFVGVGIYR
jgi:cytochrome c